jgi:hypothetical protein
MKKIWKRRERIEIERTGKNVKFLELLFLSENLEGKLFSIILHFLIF